jgi:hypothetical protein
MESRANTETPYLVLATDLPMGASFGDLPQEIVAGIVELLDTSHPPSLLSFAQTSKHQYAIASRVLFRCVRMTLGDTEGPERLRAEVQKWEAMLLRSDAFPHVRRLILYSTDLEREMPGNPYLALEPCERDDDPTHWRSCWDLYHNWWSPGDSEFDPLPLSMSNVEDWQSLVHLVRQLKGLTDVFYACVTPFPVCLLETIHAQLPRCRLHHFNFHLRDPDGAYERALSRSPALYSIGDLDHVDDVKSRNIARRHAPHLRNVFVWPSRRTINDAGRGDCEHLVDSCEAPISALQHFELGRSRADWDPDFLSDFAIISRVAFDNYSALRNLKLHSPIDYHTLPGPENFPALVTLALTSVTTVAVASSYWTAALAFIRNLPRLTTLQLVAWKRSVSVIPGLSPGLRKLQLLTHHDQGADRLLCDHIHQLATLCPLLEELAIQTRRSRGDASEVALYQALGRLPRLRSLSLELDASPSPLVQIPLDDGTVAPDTAVEPWFDAWGAEYLQGMLTKGVPSIHPYRRGHLFDVFVNSAVDQALALSIFAVIDGAKSTIEGTDQVIPLERLEVAARNGNAFPQNRSRVTPWIALRPYLHDVLARKWLVRRDVRDDARQVLHVTELCHPNGCQCVAWGTPQGWCGRRGPRKARGIDSDTRELVSKGGPFAEVWQQLWPDRGDGKGWWEAWESWPLEL